MLREIKLGFCPYSAVPLANGNILAGGQTTMVEVDDKDRVVWKLEGSELPDMGVRWFAGVQVLPGGNVLICNAGGKVPFFEINHQKRVVWQWQLSCRRSAGLPVVHLSQGASKPVSHMPRTIKEMRQGTRQERWMRIFCTVILHKIALHGKSTDLIG